MANQHTKKGSHPIYHQCDNPNCSNTVKAIQSKNSRYCSIKCANSCKTPTKYTPEAIEWIVRNASTISRKDMAARFHSTEGAFRRFVSGLRSAGYDIPKELPHPPADAGTIVERKRSNGSIRQYKKLESGKWQEILKGRPKGRPKTTGAGKRNNYRPAPAKKAPVAPREKVSRKTSRIIPKDHDKAMETSKMFVSPAIIKEKIKIILPGGNFVICDADKVDATVRFLLKKAG